MREQTASERGRKSHLQRSAVTHDVPTAAGDDASRRHARDETPALRTVLRGTAGVDNGEAPIQIHCMRTC